jgi:hypothetical protein
VGISVRTEVEAAVLLLEDGFDDEECSDVVDLDVNVIMVSEVDLDGSD